MSIGTQVKRAATTLCALVALNVVSPRPADGFSLIMDSAFDEIIARSRIESCTYTATHVVRPGDSFARIARRYYHVETVNYTWYGGVRRHVNLSQWIADANDMKLADTIQPGQVLQVPYVLRDECRRRR